MHHRLSLRFLRPVPILLLVSLAGCGPGSTGTTAKVVRISGQSPYARCTAAGPGLAYVNAEVEPQIAVDPSSPSRMIAVWQQDRWRNGAAHGLAAAYSSDDGKSWREVPLPFGACATGRAEEGRVTDPWISIGPDGTAYVAGGGGSAGSTQPDTVMIGSTIYAATSTDGGKTWHNVSIVSLRRGSVDRVSVTADPRRRGVAYIVWQSQGSTSSQAGTLFSETTDFGKTWSIPVSIVPGQLGNSGTSGNVIVVDPRTDTLYDVYDFSHRLSRPRRVCGPVAGRRRCHTFSSAPGVPAMGNDVSLVRSRDGGATWSAPRVIAHDLSVGWVAPSFGSDVRTGATLPGSAIDPRNGSLYVVWQDSRFSVGRVDDIAMSSSKDGGAHWTKPVRVNLPGKASAILPSVAVSSDGTVGVTYYQFRAAWKGAALLAEYWFRSSSDGGAHFGPPRRIAGPFDIKEAPVTFGYFIGDYEGLAAAGKAFHPVFVMTNDHDRKNRTDVFTTTVAG